MRRTVLVLVVPVLGAALAAIACSESSTATTDGADGGDASTAVPNNPAPPSSTSPTTTTPPSGSAGTGLATGLPCDVQAVLENRCIACHDGKVQAALLNFDDLTKPSKVQPTKTMAQVTIERMKAKEMPPAPAAAPEDDEIASFEEWVTGGTKRNPESCTTAPPDGGAPVDAGPVGDAGPGTCTSNKQWTKGNDGSELMHPGMACNACHQQLGGPNLRVAGTVYPSLHEPDDCIGAAPPPDRKVVITDSRGTVFEMPVNASGNFQTKNGARPRPPLKAQIVEGQKTRAMVGTVTSGDCNTCHTVNGLNGAPGRILTP